MERLKRGDFVALINPAGMLPERFINQIDFVKIYLKELGLKVKDYIVYRGWQDYKARVASLHTAFEDTEIMAIFPICGGESIYEILPILDYGLLSKNSKIICGSSQLSSLIILLSEYSRFTTFFGPHLNFINPRASKRENLFTVRSFWNMLKWGREGSNGLSKHEVFNFFRAPKLESENAILKNIYSRADLIKEINWRDNTFVNLSEKEVVAGKIMAVSIGVLVKLKDLGAKIDFSGKLLFLDSLDMSFIEFYNSLNGLLKNYNIDQASALIFSSICERTDRKDKILPELKEVAQIKSFLDKAVKLFGGKMSIFFGFPFGHCAYKLTTPIGINASLITKNGEIIIKNKPFK